MKLLANNSKLELLKAQQEINFLSSKIKELELLLSAKEDERKEQIQQISLLFEEQSKMSKEIETQLREELMQKSTELAFIKSKGKNKK